MVWTMRRSSTADLQAVRQGNRGPQVCFLVLGPPCTMGLCTAGVYAGSSATVAFGTQVAVAVRCMSLMSLAKARFYMLTGASLPLALLRTMLVPCPCKGGFACIRCCCVGPRSLQLCSADVPGQPHSASSRCCCRVRSVVVTNSTFTANVAAGNGGGLFLANNQQQTVSGSTFTANVAIGEHGLPQHT
jgi:hypothetical protein